MGKLKDYEYPELSFSRAIKMTKSFQEKIKGYASNPNALASAMGYKSGTSGPFRTKMADLRRYGLIEGRGEFKTTDLAKQVLFSHDKEEYQTSIISILNHIDLFKEIYKAKGKEVHDSQDFKIILTNITHGDRQEIEDKSERIRNIYIDLISNLDEKTRIDRAPPPRGKRPKEDLPSNMISANAGGVYIELPKKENSIGIAKQLLAMLSAQITGSEVEEPEEKE